MGLKGETRSQAGVVYLDILQKGKIYVGTDMHALQIFSAADNEPDGLVWRFAANVTHAHVDADGQRIAAGSCDMSVRVKELQPAGRDFSFEGHTAPILSVHLDPRSEFLVNMGRPQQESSSANL